MRKVPSFLAVIVITTSLGACASFSKLQNAYNVVTGATVSPQVVLVAANTFDAMEATATNYLILPRCTGANGPICRVRSATKPITSYVRRGRTARNTLEQFFRDHPGQLGPRGAYDVLQAAINGLQGAFEDYKVLGAVR